MTDLKVGYFCKSFKPDFDHLENLLESFQRHNVSDLPLVLSLPSTDIADFQSRFGSEIANLRLVTDEDYAGVDLSKFEGWFGQQICKLTSWIAADLDQYAVLDSDCYFIADVQAADLIAPPPKKFLLWGSSLRTVIGATGNDALRRYALGEEQRVDFPPVRQSPEIDISLINKARDNLAPTLEGRSALIFELFAAKHWFFYQPGQIFSRDLLKALIAFLGAIGLSVEEAIRLAPWEYNWYGEYVAAFHSNDVYFRVSPMIHIASDVALRAARDVGLPESSLAQRFFWVQMAARHLDKIKM
jgi:hypothetical protein